MNNSTADWTTSQRWEGSWECGTVVRLPGSDSAQHPRSHLNSSSSSLWETVYLCVVSIFKQLLLLWKSLQQQGEEAEQHHPQVSIQGFCRIYLLRLSGQGSWKQSWVAYVETCLHENADVSKLPLHDNRIKLNRRRTLFLYLPQDFLTVKVTAVSILTTLTRPIISVIIILTRFMAWIKKSFPKYSCCCTWFKLILVIIPRVWEAPKNHINLNVSHNSHFLLLDIIIITSEWKK